jgi:putative ABC transport system permease protein
MYILLQDLRFGVRMLLKNPGFTTIAVLTLALGIGANTAIFSVVNAVLLRPLPFKDPAALTTLWSTDVRQSGRQSSISYPDFVDWRAQSQSFERMAVFRTRSFTLTGDSEPARLIGSVVSADIFSLLGIAPLAGRGFLAEEEQPGAHVTVLSYDLWRRRYNSDPQIVGRNITLDNLNYSVVGIMPDGFQFPLEAETVELWTTIADDAVATEGPAMTSQRGLRFLQAIARLKPEVTLAQAQSEMELIAQRLERQYPDDNTHQGIGMRPAHEQLVGDVRRPLLLLSGAVGFVLMIACANVANLLLARATARRREIAIRSALGASRRRVIRQLLLESIVLALVSGACGLLLAQWGADMLVALSPENIPRLHNVSLDGYVLGFALLVSLLTGVCFGLAPALHASRTDLTEALKEGGREGTRRNRTRSVLVIAEVALALMLMTGAGLLLGSFWRLSQVNLGFDPGHVLTFRVNLPENKYSGQQAVDFFARLQARLQNLPGVNGAGVTFKLPFGSSNIRTELEIEGRPVASGDHPQIDCQVILPDYFHTMGIKLIKGRDFTARDDLKARPVAIINETLARRFFPNEDPIGKRIRPDVAGGPGSVPMREIVGVVSDVRYRNLTEDVPYEVYLPYPQLAITSAMRLALRTGADPHTLIGAARAEVQALDKELPVYEIKTLDQYVGGILAYPRFYTLILLIFAGVALLLTAIGLYGTISYSVSQRTHEIGIRMALGAQTYDVLRLVVKQGLALALIGVALGSGGSLLLTRVIKTLLFGVRSTDPLIFAAVVFLLITVALLACWIPARRATKVDPMTALRVE